MNCDLENSFLLVYLAGPLIITHGPRLTPTPTPSMGLFVHMGSKCWNVIVHTLSKTFKCLSISNCHLNILPAVFQINIINKIMKRKFKLPIIYDNNNGYDIIMSMEIKMEQAYNYGGVLSVNGIYTYQEEEKHQ